MAMARKRAATKAPVELSGEAASATAPLMREGIKVFSVTKIVLRNVLGEAVTAWLTEQRGVIVIDDIQVLQSSDAEFHCVSIIIFYRQPATAPPLQPSTVAS